MRTISIINLKGGVAKTTTADNMAHILATVHKKRVLLIDNDKQANTTKFFGLQNSKRPNINEILLESNFYTRDAICRTAYPNLEIICSDMRLLKTNLDLITDKTREQTTILRNALNKVNSQFDYCIIDNAPDINISIINALTAAHEVIIPLTIDQFDFDGLEEISRQISYNPVLKLRGCLITQYENSQLNIQGIELLKKWGYLVFNTYIRRTKKAKESTFAGKPIKEYSPRCAAAIDYNRFVMEYLG